MATNPGKVALALDREANTPLCFGEWLKHRREELSLTQAELARRVCCTVFAIRKIEAGIRRPSQQLAELMAPALNIPPEDQAIFIRVARGELGVARLPSLASAPSRDSQSILKPNDIPGNIPRSLTPFIGREPELAALSQILRDPECSLLSIVGPGGIGKTRLAIETANRNMDLFPDGVWFVPLAAITTPTLIIPTIADAINFRFQDPTNPQLQLFHHLCDMRLLLILDNAEHLIEGVGIFTELLKECRQIKLLVTSRERLNLQSEWVFELQGLPVPMIDQMEHLEEFSSVELFLQSAGRTQAGFKLRDEERCWVVQICQILEGLPLGIELSAAWIGLLSAEEIAKEIERNLGFLTVPLRDIPERHRSLRAMLDHSWNLLTPEEKVVLSRLSVFRGSFSRNAAETIGSTNIHVLSSLKNKSLLRRTDQDRFDLHELIRQYGALRLAEDVGEAERVKDLHALYYAKRLQEWEKALKSSRQLDALDQIALEIDNLRQAWQRTIRACDFNDHKKDLINLSLFQSAVFSLSLFFEMRCRYWEAITLFSQAVDTFQSAKESTAEINYPQKLDAFLGFAMAYLGHHQYLMQYSEAQETVEEAIRLLENDPSKIGQAHARFILAIIYQANGEYQKAEVLYQKNLSVFKQEEDGWWCTMTSSLIAGLKFIRGNYQESADLNEECLARIAPGDMRLGVNVLTHLGYARFFLGDYPEAERLLHESLDLSIQSGNKRQEAYNYRILGQIAMALGQNDQALKYFQDCIAIFEGYGNSPDLATCLVYLGKCLLVLNEIEPAREEFIRVTKTGLTLHLPHLIYWGLVNLARVFIQEGKPEEALEIAIVSQRYFIESKVIQDDGANLLANIQDIYSPEQIATVKDRVEGMPIESLLL